MVKFYVHIRPIFSCRVTYNYVDVITFILFRCNLHYLCNYLDLIMDMLGNAKMREAILHYYQESGDPDTVYRAIKASEDDEDFTDSSHMGYFYNTFFGKKGYVTLQLF